MSQYEGHRSNKPNYGSTWCSVVLHFHVGNSFLRISLQNSQMVNSRGRLRFTGRSSGLYSEAEKIRKPLKMMLFSWVSRISGSFCWSLKDSNQTFCPSLSCKTTPPDSTYETTYSTIRQSSGGAKTFSPQCFYVDWPLYDIKEKIDINPEFLSENSTDAVSGNKICWMNLNFKLPNLTEAAKHECILSVK